MHNTIIRCQFCGHQFPAELGKYGCPNCLAEICRGRQHMNDLDCLIAEGLKAAKQAEEEYGHPAEEMLEGRLVAAIKKLRAENNRLQRRLTATHRGNE